MNRISKKFLKEIKSYFNSEQREIIKISNLRRFKKIYTKKLLGGNFEIIDNKSFLGQYNEIFKKEAYAFNHTTESPIIIDCGANIGLSVLYFKLKYPKAQIIAFEADPEIFKTLRRNTETFNLKNVKIYQKAVWINSNSEVSFLPEGSAGGRIVNCSDKAKTIKVSSVRLKDFLTSKIDLLKIDIEGSEVEVIKDIKNKLQYVENIFIEYHSIIGQEQNLDFILSILKNNSFRYYLEQGHSRLKSPLCERTNINGFDNLINIYGYKK